MRTVVQGAFELRRVAEMVRQARIRMLRRELTAATRIAFRPLEREIRISAGRMLPKRGGYAGVMSRAVKVTTRRSGMEFTAIVYARGKKELRDVRRVDQGFLRHPVWGHRKRKWATTGVPPGFVMIPVRSVQDRLVSEGLDGLQRIIVEIARA